MKKYYLVIFFISCIFSYVIYNKFEDQNIDILLLGDINILNKEIDSDLNINTFFYDKISFNTLKKSISNNDYKVIKGKKYYLNQLIYSSDYIIVGIDKYNDYNDFLDVLYEIKNNMNILIVSNKCIKNDDLRCISKDEYNKKRIIQLIEL